MKKIALFLTFISVSFISFSQRLMHKEVEKLIEQKSYIKAENMIKAYGGEYGFDARSIELLGDVYSYQKEWENAIDNYKKLIQIDDDNANYHYKYGGALGMRALEVSKIRALGYIDDIKREFIRAATLDPKHIETRWALVELYMTLPGIIGGSKSKSLSYAEELQKLSQVDGYLAKGYIYEYDEEPDKAEYYYKKALDIGGSLTCFDKLTNLYETSNQPEKAIANLESAQKKHQRNALHYQIGKVCADYNLQLDKGEQCLKIYIENHTAADGVPKEWAYYRLAQIYKHKREKTKALDHINRALEIRSDFSQAQDEKSIILEL